MPGRTVRKHQRRLSSNADGQAGGRAGVFRPGLALERGEHAGLGERGFTDAGIADQHRQQIRFVQRRKHVNRLAAAAEEIIAVLLLHRLEPAVGRRVTPQLAGAVGVGAGRRLEQAGDILLGGRVGRDDPVMPAQERQAGRRLAFEQHHDQGEVGSLDPFVERFVVFVDLPVAEALLPDQQNEGIRLLDFPGQLRRPRAPGAQMRRREKHPRGGILALDGGFEPARQRFVGCVVAEKPTAHSRHRIKEIPHADCCSNAFHGREARRPETCPNGQPSRRWPKPAATATDPIVTAAAARRRE